MKRFVSVSLCILMAAFLISSCGKTAKTLDIDTFTKDAVSKGNYGDELILLSDNAASDYYNLSFSGLEDYAIYVSATSATASELAVMKCKDEAALKAAKSTVESRIEDQISNYENYRPDELFRLENAVITTKDNYLLFVVSDDNAAIQKLFEDQLK